MKRIYITLVCIIVTLLSVSVVNAQETRMVPQYRCLWIGPEGGTWELVNIGGTVTGMEQVAIINDNPKYTFSVELLERVENFDARYIITVKLTGIAPDESETPVE